MGYKNPRHILITGASSGIGKALAIVYATPNVRLSLSGRNQGRLDDVARMCMHKGADVRADIVDVTNGMQMRDWIAACDESMPIDLVIANAGISAGTGGDAAGENPDQVRALFAVNLYGVLNTIDPVLPNMIARGTGQIAIMSSLAGYRGWPGAPAYCASKAAVKVYGEGLRGSFAKTGVGVSVICPGFVESAMTDANDFAMPFKMSAERAAETIKRGLEKNKGRIAFPLKSLFFVWLFNVLPDRLSQSILGLMPAKSTTDGR